MASPHVAGIAALMLQKDPTLTQYEVEEILEDSAIPLAAGCRTVIDGGTAVEICWKKDATGAGLASAERALKAIH
jgi:subtilisin family serine protease